MPGVRALGLGADFPCVSGSGVVVHTMVARTASRSCAGFAVASVSVGTPSNGIAPLSEFGRSDFIALRYSGMKISTEKETSSMALC